MMVHVFQWVSKDSNNNYNLFYNSFFFFQSPLSFHLFLSLSLSLSLPFLQVTSLLSFSSESCLTDPSLRKVLQSFHNDITSHCTKVAHEAKEGKDLMSHKKLVKLVNALPRGVNRDNEDDSSPLYKLREITVSTVFKWSKERIHDTVLAEKIYNLLYRQFNESESLSKALKRTYIVECCSGGVSVFRSAIGKIKKMLLTGFGEDEEDVFKNTLK